MRRRLLSGDGALRTEDLREPNSKSIIPGTFCQASVIDKHPYPFRKLSSALLYLAGTGQRKASGALSGLEFEEGVAGEAESAVFGRLWRSVPHRASAATVLAMVLVVMTIGQQ